MLNKLHFKFQFRFLKKLCTPLSFTNNTKVPHQLQPFPKSLNFRPMFNFSSTYTQEVFRLENLSTEQRIKMKKIMDKYDTHKQDFAQLTSEDIQWMLSGLSDLSLALQEAHNPYKAKDCLADKAFIFQKLGLKDTIEDALNYYQMAFFFTSHKWYPRRKSDEVEEYLDEVDRICKLLGEDPQTKSLKVQRLFLLAQIASGKSLNDKALELYNTVLKNIDDISESALPTILPNLYQEMGRIYHEKGDTDNMIKSFENTLQVVMKYFGHKSTIDFTFLGDMAQNLDQQSAEDRIKMVLQSFPDPSERSAVICCLIGNIYLANKNLEAVYAYHEAFQIFEKLPKDYSYLLYDVYFSMASALEIDAMMPYFYKDRNKGSTDFLDKAKQALLKANGGEPNLKVADVYMRWATSYKGSDPFAAVSLSSHYRSKALEIYKTLDASNNAKIFSMNLALARIKRFGAQLTFDGYGEADWEKPLKTWKEAEKYLDPADHPSVEEVYMNLSSIYSRLENREESEKCLQKVLQSCEATGDTSYVFNSYHENAEFFEEEGKLKEALENYEIAARVYEKDAKKDHVKAQNLAAKISQIQAKLQMAQ